MNSVSLQAFADELSKIAQELSPDQQKALSSGMSRIVDEAIAGGRIVGDQPSAEEVAAAKLRLQPEVKKYPHPALLAGASLAGLGLGYGAGHLGMHGLNAALKSAYGPSSGIPTGVLKAAPYVAGITGLGVGALQAYVWDKARKAEEEREAQNVSQGA